MLRRLVLHSVPPEEAMSTQLLEIQPRELKFIFELKKQSTCSVQLTNNTHEYVAFKVKTTSPKKYCVRPNVGIVRPKSTCDFTVTMQAQREAPPDMVCKDKFLIQSTTVPSGTTDEDITASTFAKDDGRYVEENKLRVVLVSPPQSPVLSPINGTLNQGKIYEASSLKDPPLDSLETFSPPDMVTKALETKMSNTEELKPIKDTVDDKELKLRKDAELKMKEDLFDGEGLRPANDVELKPTKDAEELKIRKDIEFNPSKHVELEKTKAMEELKLVKDVEEMKAKLFALESKLSEAETTISKLTEEKKMSSREKKIVQEELAMLRSKSVVRQVQVGFPLLYVCVVAFISVILGYYLHP